MRQAGRELDHGLARQEAARRTTMVARTRADRRPAPPGRGGRGRRTPRRRRRACAVVASPVTTRPRAPTASRFDLCDRCGQRIQLDAADPSAGTGEGQQVRSDAAPEIAHRRSAGRDDSAGSMLGDVSVGRLLQAVGGEQQPVRRRLRTSPRLCGAAPPASWRPRRVSGGVVVAQSRGDRQRVRAVVRRVDPAAAAPIPRRYARTRSHPRPSRLMLPPLAVWHSA